MNNADYTEESTRAINALRSGAGYIVLEGDRPHCTFFQVGADRVPLPVLIGKMGEDAVLELHRPALTVDRNTFVSSESGDLLDDMVRAMSDSVRDDPDGQGCWRIIKDVLHVTTRFSRDPSRSRDGGDYYEYRLFSIQHAGVLACNDWSCEIEPLSAFGYDNPSLYLLGVDDLAPIAARAAAIVKSITD